MSQPERPEADGRYNRDEREFLATLHRRVDRLTSRLADGAVTQASKEWTRRELAALHWVLRLLEDGAGWHTLTVLLELEREVRRARARAKAERQEEEPR